MSKAIWRCGIVLSLGFTTFFVSSFPRLDKINFPVSKCLAGELISPAQCLPNPEEDTYYLADRDDSYREIRKLCKSQEFPIMMLTSQLPRGATYETVNYCSTQLKGNFYLIIDAYSGGVNHNTIRSVCRNNSNVILTRDAALEVGIRENLIDEVQASCKCALLVETFSPPMLPESL